MRTLAVSWLVWGFAAAVGALSVGVLARIAFALIARLKELNTSLAGAKGEVATAMSDVNEQVRRASETLAGNRDSGPDGDRTG